MNRQARKFEGKHIVGQRCFFRSFWETETYFRARGISSFTTSPPPSLSPNVFAPDCTCLLSTLPITGSKTILCFCFQREKNILDERGDLVSALSCNDFAWSHAVTRTCDQERLTAHRPVPEMPLGRASWFEWVPSARLV
jgi:hypothetical protein